MTEENIIQYSRLRKTDATINYLIEEIKQMNK